MDAQTEMTELRRQILRHDRLYYGESRPEVTDSQYDELMERLRQLERTHPQHQNPNSPTQRVGGAVSANFQEVAHPTPMLSLGNAFNAADFTAWHQRVTKLAHPSRSEGGLEMCVEAKIDGLAVRLRYEMGSLALAATRGNGLMGEDVTHNVRTVRNLPLQLTPIDGLTTMENLEVRGEVYMPRETFRRLNADRDERGEYQYSNPRNAAAGAVRQLDPALASERGLMAWVYSSTNFLTGMQDVNLKLLGDMGLPVNPLTRACRNIQEVRDFHQEVMDLRDSLPYEMDGIVVKVNDLDLQTEMGATGHEPRWAMAWKFPSEKATTLLKDIGISHGRFGKLTPVAVLEPVQVGGVVIQSASLHNEEDIHRKDIRAGEEVIIERAGDVIPQVTGPVNTNPDRHVARFTMPSFCPSCQTRVESPRNEVGHWCPNEDCPALLPEQLKHFVSKRTMDIEGMGPHWCEALIDSRLVANVADIYSLTKQDLMGLERMGDSMSTKILRNIESSKLQPMDRVLYSLGIFRLGREVSGLLAERYQNVTQVGDASAEEMSEIEGIGPKIAESVVRGFRSKRVRRTMYLLNAAGISMDRVQEARENQDQDKKEREQGMNAFEDMTFVVTGKLATMTRNDAEDVVRQHGGKVASSVTKNTTYLVVGDKPGSKLSKANSLGVPTMSESEFLEMAV